MSPALDGSRTYNHDYRPLRLVYVNRNSEQEREVKIANPLQTPNRVARSRILMMTEAAKTESSSGLQSRENEEDAPVYCALSEREKIGSIIVASMISFLSPVSGNIYYPAIDALSRDLHASRNTIYLTITVYMIVQAFVPLLTASFSDQNGRRPIFITCLAVYICVNIGLCLQNSVPALFALRCLQSVGSSGVSIVATATITDLITRAERGKYMVYASLGLTLGPAVGPLLGGVLTQFLGWRSIFIFLAIVAAVLIVLVMAFLPETCRATVGNGSIPAPWWNQSGLQWLRQSSSAHRKTAEDHRTLLTFRRRPSLWDSIRIIRQKSTGLLILASTMLSCGSVLVLASIPPLFEAHYHFNALEVGLCYIPYGVGGLTARWTMGTLADRNYNRCGRQEGITIVRNQQTSEQLRAMPLERARLQLALPMLYVSGVLVLVYGWIMQERVHVAGPLILLFLLGNVITGTRNGLVMLIIDLHAQRPATASASLGFFRSLTGAGVVAGVVPLIQAIGVGYSATLVAAVWLIVSPALYVVYRHGHDWRQKGHS
ncbi:unnamed protein product [Penicillium egyptiacum]|uniref:Major facilitator superfamily (MFS) profile domain-containing protein n=1 Tax=Penicillium egyptiacum TaxID=1303716 RepID=A0A9W4P1D9_9EURO|nr:unnamed protein product [Penicillium egyptiacum]